MGYLLKSIAYKNPIVIGGSMDKTIPFFPLKLVAFPGEKLNLHIFEPRYKQLVGDCLLHGITFGICVYLDKLTLYGTEAKIVEVSKSYEDGRMDIKTEGLNPFRIVDFRNPLEGRLYAGGEIAYMENDDDPDPELFLAYKRLLQSMLDVLGLKVNLDEVALDSYTYSHKIGLTLQDEFKLLVMVTENARLTFLIQHLQKVLAVMQQMDMAKKKIRMNGHFNYLDPLNF